MPIQFSEAGISITQNVISGILIGGYLSPSLLKKGEYVGFTASWEGNDIYSKYAFSVQYTTSDSTLNEGKEVAMIPAKLKSLSGCVTVVTDSNNVATNISLEVSCKIVVTYEDFKGSSLDISKLKLDVYPKFDMYLVDVDNDGNSDEGDGFIKVTVDSNSVMKQWPIRVGYTDIDKKDHSTITFTNGKLSIPITICLSGKMGQQDNGQTSGTNFAVGGGGLFIFKWKKDESQESQKWKFDGIEVPEI